MRLLRMSMAVVAALGCLAGCGGPPDDVAEAARQSRVAAERSSAAAEPSASPQREPGTTAARSAARPLARDVLPPVAATRPAPPATSEDRSTAVMGAGPAPGDAAAGASAMAPQRSASETRAANDALITSRVRSVLGADREVGPLHLDVDTREGVVTLSGTVPSAAARARAGDLAKSVRDVKGLNDQLTLVAG